jgi:DnaJ-class molecular chaperone
VTAEPCATCGGSGWVPDPNLPHTRNEPCRDCPGRTILHHWPEETDR